MLLAFAVLPLLKKSPQVIYFLCVCGGGNNAVSQIPWSVALAPPLACCVASSKPAPISGPWSSPQRKVRLELISQGP